MLVMLLVGCGEPTTTTETGAGGFIVCNDGERSPTCRACDAGCCSDHGGCDDPEPVCTVTPVQVDVTDPDGAAVEGCEVVIEDSAQCSEIGGGRYPDGAFAVYTALIDFPDPGCDTFAVAVRLSESAI